MQNTPELEININITKTNIINGWNILARTPDIWTLKLLYQFKQKHRIYKEQANLHT
jgi:hypothetical protein